MQHSKQTEEDKPSLGIKKVEESESEEEDEEDWNDGQKMINKLQVGGGGGTWTSVVI